MALCVIINDFIASEDNDKIDNGLNGDGNKKKELNTLKLLERYINQVKTVADKMMTKYPMLKKGKDEDSIVPFFIVAPSNEVDHIDNFLATNNYFDYKPIVILPSNMLACLNKNGKMLIEKGKFIKQRSVGNGDVFTTFKKFNIVSQFL